MLWIERIWRYHAEIMYNSTDGLDLYSSDNNGVGSDLHHSMRFNHK